MKPDTFRPTEIMDNKSETKNIVKSIRMLDGVLRTTPSATQRARVKKEIDNLRKKLGEMYPGEDVQSIEDAIAADFLTVNQEVARDFSVV